MHNVKQWALCQVWSVETFRPEEKTHTQIDSTSHVHKFNYISRRWHVFCSSGRAHEFPICRGYDTSLYYCVMFLWDSRCILFIAVFAGSRTALVPVQPTVQVRHPWHPKARFLGGTMVWLASSTGRTKRNKSLSLENGSLSNHPSNLLTNNSSVLICSEQKRGWFYRV
jgi:hypothetical protein